MQSILYCILGITCFYTTQKCINLIYCVHSNRANLWEDINLKLYYSLKSLQIGMYVYV